MTEPETPLPPYAAYLNTHTHEDTRLALAIGVFDGVHRGHQALLAAARDIARQGNLTPAALTFAPHPASVFSPSRTPELLGSLAERVALLHDHGASRVRVAPFDRAFAALTPDEFIRTILVATLNVGAVIVGSDFRFGCDRSGTTDGLRRAGELANFTVHAVAPVLVDGTPARSTTIRQMIAGGAITEAARLLGRPYALSGIVVHGRKLGRTLGYPTANLASPPEILVPAAGVYAGRAHLENGDIWPAAISVGTNPTVTPGAAPRTVEAFLMNNFSGDLYDQTLRLDFVAYLRPTLKFDSLPALVEQMAQDVETAAQILTP